MQALHLQLTLKAEIIDAGQDYTEEPNVFIFDSSGKGKGALFTCQIDTATGRITEFTKLSGGFDYQETQPLLLWHQRVLLPKQPLV